MKSILCGSILFIAYLLFPSVSTGQCSDWTDYDQLSVGTGAASTQFDELGNLYVMWNFRDSIQIAQGSYQTNAPVITGLLIAKYNSQGNPLWAEMIESNDNNIGIQRLRCHEDRLYLTALTNEPITAGTITVNNTRETPILVVMDTSGTALDIKTFPTTTTSSNFIRDIEIDNSGNIIVAGFFNDSITFGTTVLSKPASLASGSRWGFYTKLDRNGDLIWAKSCPSTTIEGNSDIWQVEIGASNEIYLGGQFNLDAEIGSLNLVNNVPGYNLSPFIAKVDSNGNGIWEDHGLGNSFSNVFPTAMAVTAQGETFMATSQAGADTIWWAGNTFARRDANVVITKHDASGSMSFFTQYNASPSFNSLITAPRGMAVDPTGLVWVAGVIEDTTIIGANTLLLPPNGVHASYYFSIDPTNQIGNMKYFAGQTETVLTSFDIDNNSKKAMGGYFQEASIQLDNQTLPGSSLSRTSFVFVDCDFAVGAKEAVAGISQLDIYPNPTASRLHLDGEFANPSKGVTVVVFDLYGRKVHEVSKATGSAAFQMDFEVGHLSSGTYLLNVSNEKGVSVRRRFVKM